MRRTMYAFGFLGTFPQADILAEKQVIFKMYKSLDKNASADG